MLNSDKIMAPEDRHTIDNETIEGSFGTYSLSDIETKLKECSERERHLHKKNEEFIALLSDVYDAMVAENGLPQKLVFARKEIYNALLTDAVQGFISTPAPAKVLRKRSRK